MFSPIAMVILFALAHLSSASVVKRAKECPTKEEWTAFSCPKVMTPDV
jgi:hypothetical protein